MTVVLVVLWVFLPTVLRFPAPTSRKSRDVGHPIRFRLGLKVHRSFVGSRSLSRVTPLPQDDNGFWRFFGSSCRQSCGSRHPHLENREMWGTRCLRMVGSGGSLGLFWQLLNLNGK